MSYSARFPLLTLLSVASLLLACGPASDGASGPHDPGSGASSVTIDGHPLDVTASLFATNSKGELLATLGDNASLCTSRGACSGPPDGNYVVVSYAGVATGDYLVGATATLDVVRYQGGRAVDQRPAVTGAISLDGYRAEQSAAGHFDVGLRDGTRARGTFVATRCVGLTDLGRGTPSGLCSASCTTDHCDTSCSCGSGANVASCDRTASGGSDWICHCTSATGVKTTCSATGGSSASPCCKF